MSFIMYGYLNMNSGEKLAQALEYITALVKQEEGNGRKLESLQLGFDIIATPTQIKGGKAKEIARSILRYVDSAYPNLNKRVVGITCNDKKRPVRDIIFTKTLKISQIDNKRLFVEE